MRSRGGFGSKLHAVVDALGLPVRFALGRGQQNDVAPQRWGLEGFFAKLKQWRRIATRYDKLAAKFLSFVKLASTMLWLK